jgi:hypothetical protein
MLRVVQKLLMTLSSEVTRPAGLLAVSLRATRLGTGAPWVLVDTDDVRSVQIISPGETLDPKVGSFFGERASRPRASLVSRAGRPRSNEVSRFARRYDAEQRRFSLGAGESSSQRGAKR